MFVWVEWKCFRCGGLHRARFQVMIQNLTKVTARMRNSWIHDEIRIEDVALRISARRKRLGKTYRGSRIHIANFTSIRKILNTLSKYMMEYYSIQPNTLKMEVCYAE